MKNLFFSLLIVLLSVTNSFSQDSKILMKTELGDIELELYPEKAPVTASNFLKYVDEKRFVRASFYRVVRMDNQPHKDVKIEVIQGGIAVNESSTSVEPKTD